MVKKLMSFWLSHRKAIILTFEIFWILVFLMKMASDQSGSSIPQFVYVNF